MFPTKKLLKIILDYDGKNNIYYRGDITIKNI